MEFDLNFLLNFGVLGFWTLSLLYEKKSIQEKFLKAIDNNTIAINSLMSKMDDISSVKIKK